MRRTVESVSSPPVTLVSVPRRAVLSPGFVRRGGACAGPRPVRCTYDCLHEGYRGSMPTPGEAPAARPFRMVVIVASLGGLAAVIELLAHLPASFPAPILLMTHRSPTADEDQHVSVLQRHSSLPVRLARP